MKKTFNKATSVTARLQEPNSNIVLVDKSPNRLIQKGLSMADSDAPSPRRTTIRNPATWNCYQLHKEGIKHSIDNAVISKAGCFLKNKPQPLKHRHNYTSDNIAAIMVENQTTTNNNRISLNTNFGYDDRNPKIIAKKMPGTVPSTPKRRLVSSSLDAADQEAKIPLSKENFRISKDEKNRPRSGVRAMRSLVESLPGNMFQPNKGQFRQQAELRKRSTMVADEKARRDPISFKYRKFASEVDRNRFDQFMSNDFILNLIEKSKNYCSDNGKGDPQNLLSQPYKNQICEKKIVRENFKGETSLVKELLSETDFRNILKNSENRKLGQKEVKNVIYKQLGSRLVTKSFGTDSQAENPYDDSKKSILIDNDVIQLSDRNLATSKVMGRLQKSKVRYIKEDEFYTFLNKETQFDPKTDKMRISTDEAMTEYHNASNLEVDRKNIYFNFVEDDFKQINMKNIKKFQAREAASSDYFKVLDSKVASNIKEVLDMVEKGQKTLQAEQYKLRGELCHVESASSNRKKLQLIILNCLKKLTQMGLFAVDTHNSAIFPTEPFERKNSTMFFKFVKRNDKIK
jgi:hypothetical protein